MNALTLPMIRAIETALHEWETDSTLEAILLDGAGHRGFCAGGDLRTMHRAIHTDPSLARQLWYEEYLLDAHLARFPHPVVSLMDGTVMGGGLGISAHGGTRLVTERSQLAMPETALGLAPDVGGAFLLAQAPGELGTHLALTGARIGGHTALACGFADHLVPADSLPHLTQRLCSEGLGALPEALDQAAAAPEPPADSLLHEQGWITACYASTTVETILASLQQRPEPHAQHAAHVLASVSPTALKVTLQAMRHAARMSALEECLIQDYRVSCRCLQHPDLAEGIRATVIDKDHTPTWSPACLEHVTHNTVTRYFQPLGAGELPLQPTIPVTHPSHADNAAQTP